MAEGHAGFDLSDPRQLVALGFGSGLSPWAPGTAGSLAAIPLILVLSLLPTSYYGVAVLVSVAMGVWVCGAAARAVGVHDHGAIVWDEIAGMLVAVIALPINPWTLAVAFIAFRGFDILKPWPIRWLDRRIGGGLGIMLDDILAGGAALALGHALVWGNVPGYV